MEHDKDQEKGENHEEQLAGRTLLNPLACLYHSFILFRVDFLVRSNMNRMATASFDTRGNMLTNSR
jgi:hypothetical protein